MDRKAFTIVELAIVLVVIGIILAMVVKGKSLVDAARMRAEVAKVNKFEAAISEYYSLTGGKLPQIAYGNRIDRRPFIDAGLLTEKDYEINIGTIVVSGREYKGYWAMGGCSSRDRPYMFSSWMNIRSQVKNICILGVPDPDDITTAQTINALDIRLVCNIEVMKDDQFLGSGIGRTSYVVNPGDTWIHEMDYKDCDNNSNDIRTAGVNSRRSYAVKIF